MARSKAHGSADDRRLEAGRSGASVGGCGAGETHDRWLEGKVRRDGCEPGAGSEAVARREHATEEAGSGSESGQGSIAVDDPKKRVELVALKCDSQDLTLQAILSNGVATVRQTLSRVFSAMAAERAKKRSKLVLTPVGVEKVQFPPKRSKFWG